MHKNFKCSLRYGSINCVVPVFEYIECFVGDGEYSVLMKTRENTLISFIPPEVNVCGSPSLLGMMINDKIKSHTF